MFVLNILTSAQEYLTSSLSYVADVQANLHVLEKKYFVLRPIVPVLVLCPLGVANIVLKTALIIVNLLCGQPPAWVYELSD